jgi:hypothetical protein
MKPGNITTMLKLGVMLGITAGALIWWAPVVADNTFQINPDVIKKLLNKNKSGVIKPGFMKDAWLYKFNVPVNIMDAHPDITRAGVACAVTLKTGSAKGFAMAGNSVALNNGAYNGTIPVIVWKEDINTSPDNSGMQNMFSATEGLQGKASHYKCRLFFLFKNGDGFPAGDDTCSDTLPVELAKRVCARPDPTPQVEVEVSFPSGDVPPPPSQN